MDGSEFWIYSYFFRLKKGNILAVFYIVIFLLNWQRQVVSETIHAVKAVKRNPLHEISAIKMWLAHE